MGVPESHGAPTDRAAGTTPRSAAGPIWCGRAPPRETGSRTVPAAREPAAARYRGATPAAPSRPNPTLRMDRPAANRRRHARRPTEFVRRGSIHQYTLWHADPDLDQVGARGLQMHIRRGDAGAREGFFAILRRGATHVAFHIGQARAARAASHMRTGAAHRQ